MDFLGNGEYRVSQHIGKELLDKWSVRFYEFRRGAYGLPIYTGKKQVAEHVAKCLTSLRNPSKQENSLQNP